MEKILKTMGEGLSDEELNTFFELACSEGAPDLIDIRKITELLLPKIESTNLLATRNTAETSGAADDGQEGDQY